MALGRPVLRVTVLMSLVTAVLIVVGGGVVRVTGSGLGCPDWPTCAGGELAPTSAMGLHGVIEFANRLLTGLLCAVVGCAILAARLQRVAVPDVTRWAWLQFWIVLANAVLGGITVLVRLSPYMVAAHFIAAMLLLAAAAVTWDRVVALDAGATDARRLRPLARTLLAATALLVLLGTVATGTGPHAGDSSDVPRMPVSWAAATWTHATVAAACFGLAVTLRVLARRERREATSAALGGYLVVFLAQGLLGVVQSLTGLPETVVVLHLLGSALVWIGAVRIYLSTARSTGTQPAG